MSIWNIEEYKPRAPRAQPNLQSAYLWDKERALPDLEAGFRLQSSDQAWVPPSSYLFLVNQARLPSIDPHAWGPEYESFLQTRIDQNEGYVCPLDAASERDYHYNLDGFPINQPPKPPQPTQPSQPIQGRIGGKGERLGQKRKGIYAEEVSKKEEAPLGYFPNVSYEDLENKTKRGVRQFFANAGPQTQNIYAEALDKKRGESNGMKEEVKENLDEMDKQRSNVDEAPYQANPTPLDDEPNLEKMVQKNMNEFSKTPIQPDPLESFIDSLDSLAPMRSPEYKRKNLFSTPQQQFESMSAILNYVPSSGSSELASIPSGMETPNQSIGNRSTTLNASSQQSSNLKSGSSTPRSVIFSSISDIEEERKDYSPPSKNPNLPYSPTFPNVNITPVKEKSRPQTPATKEVNFRYIQAYCKDKFGVTAVSIAKLKSKLTVAQWEEAKRNAPFKKNVQK